MKRYQVGILFAALGVVAGYVIGAYHMYDRANLASYEIGFEQGYGTGLSDAVTAYKTDKNSDKETVARLEKTLFAHEEEVMALYKKTYPGR